MKRIRKQPSLQELLVRQVLALVRETADAVCPEGKNILELEGELLDVLATNCASRRDVLLNAARKEAE